MRAGDFVLHRPSGERWVVAYVDGDYLAWCGWPQGEALVSDCDLIEKASDDAHKSILERLSKIGDKRGWQAKFALASLKDKEG